jgi:uncharacterized protein (TIGR02099 family)
MQFDSTQTRRGARRGLLRALELLAWSAFFAAAALVLALRYWVLPNVERHRDAIVAELSSSIGLPVRVGAIEAGWSGLRPRIDFSDVRLHDVDGREALALPEVRNEIAWRSLLHAKLRLHRFEIVGPRLAVRRDRAGALHVAGMKLAEAGSNGRLTDWLLAQSDVVVRDAEIDWHDELRGAPPLALARLQLHLRNDGDRHAVGLSARPPAELGTLLEVRAELTGRSVTDAAAWNGTLYAELGYTDLAGWRAWVDYPVDVRRGQGALRVWASLAAGEVQRIAADVALSGVAAQADKGLPLLEIASVRGRLEGRRTPRGYEFAARRLALAPLGGPEMLASSFRVSFEPASGNAPERGALYAEQLELEPLAHLGEFLPLPAELKKMAAAIAPRGSLHDVKFEWTGALPEPQKFSARLRFNALAMRPWRAVPGFAGLSGTLEANPQRGTVFLATQKAELDLPKVFPEPRIRFDALNGQLEWQRGEGRQFDVRLGSLAFANEHFAGSASGTYRYTDAGPGVIDLSAQISRADGRHAARYLPLESILGRETRRWLHSSILAAQGSDAQLRLKGDLRDFPFTQAAKGLFQVKARFSGGALDYAEGWPRISDIQGELLFERDRMEIVGRSATILGAKLSDVRATIPSMLAEEVHLMVSGRAEGPTADFLKYVDSSPVRRMIGGFTDGMSATGRGRLELKLNLPLEKLERSRIAGEYHLNANTVSVSPQLPPIERASGRLSFTESGLTLHDVAGRLFDGPVTLSGGTRAEGGVEVTARGRASVEAMRALLDHPWRQHLTGSADYVARVGSRDGQVQVSLESPLQGVASALPPPLGKTAAESMPIRITVLPAEGGSRDRISVEVGVLQAEFLRRRDGAAMAVQRAMVRLGPARAGAPKLPERPGLLVYGELAELDIERWRPFLKGEEGTGGPSHFDLRIGTLDAFGKRVHQLALRLGADAAGWSASVDAREFAGDLSYRGEQGGKLIARLTHFRIPDDSPGARLAEPTRELPAVDLIAERFTFRGKQLGRVEIAAQRSGPDWRIDRMRMTNPDASLTGNGLWRAAQPSRTLVRFKLESNEVGKFLERLGYPDRLKGGTGTLEGGLEWAGDPVALDYPSLSGDLALEIDKGEFPQIETGFGRLLSLLSLHLTDVFSKGYQFDKMSGSLRVRSGVMNTPDLRLNGSAAVIEVAGDIDLARETQNMRIKVTPSVRRSVATLVGIANPAIGVATAIVQGVLKDPLGQILAHEYTLSGTWDQPKVEPVAPPKPAATSRPVEP